tara:strand:- start:463 stop:891 length:429 start_codon:yes stop_codon:yes gene_type:complete
MTDNNTGTISGLHLFLMKYQNEEFVWGWKDCNTFVVEYVDYLKATTIYTEVQGKYFNIKSAIKFVRNYKCLNVGLKEQGFTEVSQAQDGDIITYPKFGFVCGHIVGYGRVHSMEVDAGYIAVPLSKVDLTDTNIKIWRYTSG